jgi:serine/threonine-protein phosphatase 5
MSAMTEQVDEVLAAANALKDEGNTFLQQKQYSSAAQKYSEAIELRPTAVFYSNRAMAMIKLESYGSAILDANESIALDPAYIKAYYRRGSANFALGKTKEARKDFRTVCKLKPKDADAKKKLLACEKAVKAQMFLDAMESEQTAPLSQKLSIDEIEVESSYDGPHLEYVETADGKDAVVTPEFVMQMMDRFKSQKSIHKKYMMQLLVAAVKYLSKQSTLLRVSLPTKSSHITVCGDTHGQFFDLCNIFEQGGMPSPTNPYLFNGDFVDRGSFSLEVVVTLLAFKLAMPDALFMLRGNHETKGMNKIYGFEGEVKHKFDDNVMGLFTEVFHWLPLAAVIQDTVFVVHGGLSTANDGAVSLDDINSIQRNREPPESGLMSDLMWSGKCFVLCSRG